MLESYRNKEVEDFKQVGNNYYLKIKDGPELRCDLEGTLLHVEGEKNLDGAIIKDSYVASTGRKVEKDLKLTDLKSVNVLTNKGMFCIRFKQSKSVRDKSEIRDDATWTIN
jgi:hypothetical protein